MCGDGCCVPAEGETASGCPEDCGYRDLAATSYSTCGLRNDGSVWCWGGASVGTLGTGERTDSLIPVKVAGLFGVQALSAGSDYVCAQKPNSVWCWGANDQRQLGTTATPENCGGVPCFTAPQQVPGVVAPLRVAAANSALTAFTCALTSTGTLCWGNAIDDGLGVLNPGALTTSCSTGVGVTGSPATCAPTPEPAVDLAPTTADVVVGRAFGCAVEHGDFSDQLRCWGRNQYGAVGTGEIGSQGGTLSYPDPQPTLGTPTPFASLSAGPEHVIALSGGTIWVWGRNDGFFTGIESNDTGLGQATQLPLAGDVVVSAVAAGRERFSCAIVDDAAWCWGLSSMPLGRTCPVDTCRQPGAVEGELNGAAVVKIAPGSAHVCAARADGRAWCWGAAGLGQLGYGGVASASLPVEVFDPVQ